MRNALICAGTMLALLVLWPLVFGAGGASMAAANTVTIPIPPRVVKDRAAPLAALPPTMPGIESCRATRSRARRACAPGDAACAEAVADAFDICEAKGMWPS